MSTKINIYYGGRALIDAPTLFVINKMQAVLEELHVVKGNTTFRRTFMSGEMSPANPGHALVLPKEHFQDIFDIDSDVLGKAMKLAKKVAARQTEVLGCDGVNIIQNNKEAAGQSVLHYHLHVIPRFKNDGQKMLWTPDEISAEKQIEVRNRLVF